MQSTHALGYILCTSDGPRITVVIMMIMTMMRMMRMIMTMMRMMMLIMMIMVMMTRKIRVGIKYIAIVFNCIFFAVFTMQ